MADEKQDDKKENPRHSKRDADYYDWTGLRVEFSRSALEMRWQVDRMNGVKRPLGYYGEGNDDPEVHGDDE